MLCVTFCYGSLGLRWRTFRLPLPSHFFYLALFRLVSLPSSHLLPLFAALLKGGQDPFGGSNSPFRTRRLEAEGLPRLGPAVATLGKAKQPRRGSRRNSGGMLGCYDMGILSVATLEMGPALKGHSFRAELTFAIVCFIAFPDIYAT